jgi:hypothetical protein
MGLVLHCLWSLTILFLDALTTTTARKTKPGDWPRLTSPNWKPNVCAMEHDSPTMPKRTLTDILFILFLRLVAISCFCLGLQYWAMLVGYSLVGAGRFDLLSLPWKVAATSLAVLFPVASLGLWLTVSWGPVLWVLAAGGQILMYGLLPETFGANRLIILMHGAVALVYLAFRVVLWLENRRQRRQVSVDLP